MRPPMGIGPDQQANAPDQVVCLKGNHEVLLETFLRDSSIGDYWRRLGGVETMHSYGISVSELMLGKGFEEARLSPSGLRSRRSI